MVGPVDATEAVPLPAMNVLRFGRQGETHGLHRRHTGYPWRASSRTTNGLTADPFGYTLSSAMNLAEQPNRLLNRRPVRLTGSLATERARHGVV
jgi:hypothetical protein